MEDVYYKLFEKMYKIGFPTEFKGYKMIYDYKTYQADLELFPTERKLLKMWELLGNGKQ